MNVFIQEETLSWEKWGWELNIETFAYKQLLTQYQIKVFGFELVVAVLSYCLSFSSTVAEKRNKSNEKGQSCCPTSFLSLVVSRASRIAEIPGKQVFSPISSYENV